MDRDLARRLRRWLGLVVFASAVANARAQSQPPNLVFVYVDDLNADVDLATVKTPHLKAMAAKGVKFTRAYASHPICNASRLALLAGQRTMHTDVVLNEEATPKNGINGVEYLPKRLRSLGYYSYGLGKIFQGSALGTECWDESYTFTDDDCDGTPFVTPGAGIIFGGPYMNGANDDVQSLRDSKAVKKAYQLLAQARIRIETTGQPFALWIGFQATHDPFIYPERFLDDYVDADVPALPAAEIAGAWKSQVHPVAYTTPNVYDPAWAPTEEQRRIEARKAYFRCISYVDEQLGKLRGHLKFLHLDANTVVVFVSDHGFSFSEHAHISKSTGFEQDVVTPMIVAAPSKPATHGGVYSDPVEHVDLYPTLMHLLGLPTPAGLDGTSLVPILENLATPHGPAYYTTARHHGMNVTRFVVEKDAATGTVWKLGAWENAQDVAPVHQLYDLTADPGEYQNLYLQPGMEPRIAQLRQRLTTVGMLGPSSRNYGKGSPGSLGVVPALSATSPPAIGSTTSVAASSSSGTDAFGVLVLGYRGLIEPLFCGTQWVRDDYVYPVPLPAAGLTLPFSIPSLPALHEVPVGMQLVAADPGAPCGVALSRGLQLFLSN